MLIIYIENNMQINAIKDFIVIAFLQKNNRHKFINIIFKEICPITWYVKNLHTISVDPCV